MSDRKEAVFRVHIRGAIEDVWHEITKTDEAQGAFFNAWLHTPGLQAGAPIRMRSRSGKYTTVVGDVVEFDPPRRYAHTMKFTAYDDPECTVIYDLQPSGDGVDFTLTIENAPEGTKTAKDMLRGGPFITKNLKAIIETGKPTWSARLMYRVFGLMEGFTPKKCLSSNWEY
jgi:uncharacterized protein YndB with AHSA1/START domain